MAKIKEKKSKIRFINIWKNNKILHSTLHLLFAGKCFISYFIIFYSLDISLLIAHTGKYLTLIANGKKVLANLLSSFDFFDYLCNILLCQSDIDTTIKQWRGKRFKVRFFYGCLITWSWHGKFFKVKALATILIPSGMDFLIDGQMHRQMSSFCPDQPEAMVLTLIMLHKLTQYFSKL